MVEAIDRRFTGRRLGHSDEEIARRVAVGGSTGLVRREKTFQKGGKLPRAGAGDPLIRRIDAAAAKAAS